MEHAVDLSSIRNLDILSSVRSDEVCFVIEPSTRLNAARLSSLFTLNGVESRVLGQGTGTIRDAHGERPHIRGLLVLAVMPQSVNRLSLLVRLFGAIAIPVRSKKIASK